MTSELDLRGRSALVTGAGRRVGRAIALALGRAGMRVGVHFHQSEEAARSLVGELEALGSSGVLLRADLSERSAARALVAQAVTELGGLDLLVGSAASFETIEWTAVDDDAWDRALELNLASQFALAQAAAPALLASHGSMVFLTCQSTTLPFRRHLPYVVSKGALKQLVRVLALELSPHVRVNAVAPGTVLFAEDTPDDLRARIEKRIPLGHSGTPEDVAAAVLYLARSPFVTGQELVVDGGRSLV